MDYPQAPSDQCVFAPPPPTRAYCTPAKYSRGNGDGHYFTMGEAYGRSVVYQ
jgi:hypothetical protein